MRQKDTTLYKERRTLSPEAIHPGKPRHKLTLVHWHQRLIELESVTTVWHGHTSVRFLAYPKYHNTSVYVFLTLDFEHSALSKPWTDDKQRGQCWNETEASGFVSRWCHMPPHCCLPLWNLSLFAVDESSSSTRSVSQYG
jgi:hypothetical protein